MIDLAAFNWPVISTVLAAATIALILWLAVRDKPRLRIAIKEGTHPGYTPPVPALILTVENTGASTILRRGWVSWGAGANDRTWSLPVVGEVGVPGGGLLFGSGKSIEIPVAVSEILEATSGVEPLELGVEDKNGNVAGVHPHLYELFNGRFRPTGGR